MATSLTILPISAVVLPGGFLSLRVKSPSVRRLLTTQTSAFIGLVPIVRGKLNHVGTCARVIKVTRTRRGQHKSLALLIEGKTRFRVPDNCESGEQVTVVPLEDDEGDVSEAAAFDDVVAEFKREAHSLLALIERQVPLFSRLAPLLETQPRHRLADLFASAVDASFPELVGVLNSTDLLDRFREVLKLMRRQASVFRIAFRVGQHLEGDGYKQPSQGDDDDTNNNNNTLFSITDGEEKKALKNNADNAAGDEDDDGTSAAVRLAVQLRSASLPPEVKRGAMRELRRLQEMERANNVGPEHQKAATYLEWLVNLPWQTGSPPNTATMDTARHILDQDHHGLEKVKRRILEYSALKLFHKEARGQILCLVGPPGVGKTSLGRSIAKTLGRKFCRVSLGGIRDEADIRGFNRTYVGSQPGKIMQALRRVGSNDPVILLDEIDKVSQVTSHAGNPGNALLELLDPVQNAAFLDHYINYPFDLSQVIFVATANTKDTIPRPLLDRMEVIELSGYTLEEKIEIARKHIAPRQMSEHGLSGKHLHLTDDLITTLCEEYTHESGVRELERKVAAVCRAAVVRALEHEDGNTAKRPYEPSVKDLQTILGPPVSSLTDDPARRVRVPGVSIGLAANSIGGRVLFIEATRFGGTGKFELTGSLGDVLKESALIARDWVRSKCDSLRLAKPFVWDKTDIHVHLPEGAVGKDGPSAGVALTVALVSLLTDRVARNDTAMTGEVTLSGAVLPVGGIKQKVLAAHRLGIRRILLPAANFDRHVPELPKAVLEEMEFVPLTNVQQALKEAFAVDVGTGQPSPELSSKL